MTTQEAIDKLTALAAIAGFSEWTTRRAVYLSPGDTEALRLAVEALRDRLDHHE